MYASIYVHRVPRTKLDQVLSILKDTAEIYNDYGALGCRVYTSEKLEAKYGCTTFPEAIDLGEGEVFVVELNVFRDDNHYDGLMLQIDKDKRIEVLYARLAELIDIGRTIRGEFDVAL